MSQLFNVKRLSVLWIAMLSCVAVISTGGETIAQTSNWANWRGPEQNGISRETNLVDTWSFEPRENVDWVSDTGGRCTPIVLNGRVYLNCRTTDDFNDAEEKIHSREQVICWSEDGKELWRDQFNVFKTDIPSPRVGWAAMCGDEETGYVYSHSVSGLLKCYSPDGKIVWEKSLAEEFGKISGYGGRTQTPIIDEDRLIVSFLATNWGDMKGPAPLHYYYAFDKKTGDLQWISAPGGAPKDTNYSAPVVAVIKGQRMLVGGNADGAIYAMNARTGKPIWGFRMSLRGLNTTPVVVGDKVFISHGEDNIDNQEFGRVQCIDATGTGDVTETHGLWRQDGVKAGYTALLSHDGMLFVVADIGNMICYDCESGERLWEHDLGTVGKGSPVWADGKIYATEVNGNMHILKPSRTGCEVLSHVSLNSANGVGKDEIYASPAIANGRVYLVARDRTICIRDKSKEVVVGKPMALPEETATSDTIDMIQIRPYEVILDAGSKQDFTVHAFDANGRLIKKMPARDIKISDDLKGLTSSGASVMAPADLKTDLAGTISVDVDGKTANARIRVFNPMKKWAWDFEGYKGIRVPPTWCRAHIKIKPFEMDGGTVMKVTGGSKIKGRPSHHISIGPPEMGDHTIQADVRMSMQRRQLASVGLSSKRYDLYLKGNTNRLQIRSWAPHLRMAKDIKFKCDPDQWYTMKMKVEANEKEATIYGKVWKRGEEEPTDWTITATDPHPNLIGSPGLIYYAQADCFFDNVMLEQTSE
jgi:outer membrane protein assembly factor BamB